MILFYLAKKRIIAAGGTAVIGNAVWMTLAGMLCLTFSGCFFGVSLNWSKAEDRGELS